MFKSFEFGFSRCGAVRRRGSFLTVVAEWQSHLRVPRVRVEHSQGFICPCLWAVCKDRLPSL
eukprot:1750743-Amphidinium_carterae.1